MIHLLADSVGPGVHISLFKLATVLALSIAWMFGCQWVDQDTENVKTKREQWNLIVLGSGIAGIAVLILIPWSGTTFLLGLVFWILLAGGGQLTYIIHRNGRVIPDQRMLTVAHFKRIMARDRSDKANKIDRGQRIHLSDAEGQGVDRPGDREIYEKYCVLQDFLFDVMWRRASDVDVVVGKEKVRVIYRIDGVASERNDVLGLEDAERLMAYVKVLAGLNPEEYRRPQEGCVFASLLGDAGDLGLVNVVTSGSTAGERLRLKIQKPTARKKLDALGFASQRLAQVNKLIEQQTGLVLLCGLHGSGVTTTQYAVLRTHDAFMRNIHVLERRQLYELDNMTQVKHEGKSEEISYARQLQSVLRREPDIVGIGECEDRETAQIALRAGASDRKIYMAIEAKSALDALSRLMGLAEDKKLMADGLLGVINQRLIRTLCTSCRQSFKPDENLLRKANIPPDKVEHFHRPPTEPVYDRKGREIICQSCQGSGYVGRTGVFEVLIVDDQIRELIAAGAPIKQIKGQARKNKMHYIQEEGLLKVIDGTTSLDEVIRGLRDEAK